MPRDSISWGLGAVRGVIPSLFNNELTQPRLIDSILEEVFGTDDLPSPKAVPMASSKLLSRHHDSPDYEGRYEMRRIVGKLNFLASSTRPDIAYATHQIARFVSAPKVEHGKAVEWLAKYLLGTRKQGYLISPDPIQERRSPCRCGLCRKLGPDACRRGHRHQPFTAWFRHLLCRGSDIVEECFADRDFPVHNRGRIHWLVGLLADGHPNRQHRSRDA